MGDKALAIVPHDEDGTQRIVLTGELDVSTVPAFNKRVSELRQTASHSLVLDLSGITFMDSTGLSAILVTEMHARMRGQRFSVVEGPPHVNRALPAHRRRQLPRNHQQLRRQPERRLRTSLLARYARAV